MSNNSEKTEAKSGKRSAQVVKMRHTFTDPEKLTESHKKTHTLLLARANKILERFRENESEYRIFTRVNDSEIRIVLDFVNGCNVNLAWIVMTDCFTVELTAFGGLVGMKQKFTDCSGEATLHKGKLVLGTSRTQATVFGERYATAIIAIRTAQREFVRQAQGHFHTAINGDASMRVLRP